MLDNILLNSALSSEAQVRTLPLSQSSSELKLIPDYVIIVWNNKRIYRIISKPQINFYDRVFVGFLSKKIGKMFSDKFYAPVAQLAEHCSYTAAVEGSSPSGSTNLL